jgi:hypothetical protein
MQVLDRQNDRLGARAGHEPIDDREDLLSATLLWRQRGRPVNGQRNVDQRREQRRVRLGIEMDLGERRLELAQALFRLDGLVPETQTTPIEDRMEWCVLQELRRAPFHPGVWRVAQPAAKFVDHTGLSNARLADEKEELTFAAARAFPAGEHRLHLLVAIDERRQPLEVRPPTAAAGTDDAQQRGRLGNALEVTGAAILNDKQARDESVDAPGD